MAYNFVRTINNNTPDINGNVSLIIDSSGNTLQGGTGIDVTGGIISLTNTSVVAGTYKSLTIDDKGRATAGTNPTTLTGYGITDAYTKEEIDAKFQLILI